MNKNIYLIIVYAITQWIHPEDLNISINEYIFPIIDENIAIIENNPSLKGFSWLYYFEKIGKARGYDCAFLDSCENAASLREFVDFFKNTDDQKLKQKYISMWKKFFSVHPISYNYISHHPDGQKLLSYLN